MVIHFDPITILINDAQHLCESWPSKSAGAQVIATVKTAIGNS